MATVVQENVNTLNEILEHSMDNAESLDLFHVLNRFTFEVISEIAFGIKFGGLVSKSEHPVEAAFNFAQQRMFERFQEPMRLWKLQRWLNVGSEHRLRKIIQIIDNTCYDIISRSMEERKTAASAATDGKRNIISLFLDGASDDTKSDQDLDPKYLRDIVVSFMTAGRDTTTAALSWFFYTVSQHPEVEEKIRDEIFSKIPELANGVISSPSTSQVNDLLYLEATVKEVLRSYPSIPSNIREALEDVVLCDGTVMKAGEAVSWSAYSMGRMTRLWGIDAKEFKPERCIDATTGKLVTVSSFKYLFFNAGPRTCLGTKLAMMEIKITAANVLSKYHLTVCPGQTVTYRIGLSLVMKNVIKVKVEEVSSFCT
ncbi:Cytochrome P450 [Phytophthora infestans]|uniref:Cytochrome P450 n=1 Tax=Phytophthora infestans TaxID=4787 RepID=A0A8S9TPE5_PHYIN|nr:Cytochrome P450 [Phytophthora infestans]